MKTILLVSTMSIALVLALAGGYDWGLHSSHQNHPTNNAASPHKILYWYDPMMPAQHFNHPGKSPFMPSMDLVPQYAVPLDQAAAAPSLRIDPRIEQNLGMRTAVVHVGSLSSELLVTGTLDWDQNHAVVISARTDGILTHLFVRTPYEQVRAGQPLGTLLSPSWSSAAAELNALNAATSGDAPTLRAAALARMHVLGMTTADIRQLTTNPSSGVTLRSPINGVVSTLNVLPGQRVAAGTTLMRIDNPHQLWLNAAIPQAEVASMHAGTIANISIDALPGKTWTGTIAAMLPEIDPRTRTQTARIVLTNADNQLAPGMFATIRLYPAGGRPFPLVPDNALISTGTDNRVILDLGHGQLEPRAVRIGHSADGYTEILAGLNGGERVVISGEFLFDSEAEMNGALDRLTKPMKPMKPMKPRILFWYDPMAPSRHYSHGGPSPLMPSMNLVPRYDHAASPETVTSGEQP